uniref:Testis specific protein Y-linked n=1 Tax=Gasterosteus aculeatus aculeatus TaxID=481459 RepID=A0AAQ4S9J2_GASAC
AAPARRPPAAPSRTPPATRRSRSPPTHAGQQSVALLAEVQMRLEALEKKSARLHQRMELKISRQRRPHLDQRSSITKTIPGFWVTALLNHPHLSAHIDETDEDALSYMTDLEVGISFKNNKLGYRIRFHFRRNPYFQNNIIMKELHLGMGGSPMSFSNPILWQRGQNLTAHSEPRKSSRGVYKTFFSWFSDHSSPGQDDVAQVRPDLRLHTRRLARDCLQTRRSDRRTCLDKSPACVRCPGYGDTFVDLLHDTETF